MATPLSSPPQRYPPATVVIVPLATSPLRTAWFSVSTTRMLRTGNLGGCASRLQWSRFWTLRQWPWIIMCTCGRLSEMSYLSVAREVTAGVRRLYAGGAPGRA